MSERLGLTYVLPLRWSDDLDRDELTDYLTRLSSWVTQVLVVDGSDEDDFRANAQRWADVVQHVRPDPDLRFSNGKVNGVTTGVRAALFDKVVIADDDVRYDRDALAVSSRLLDDADLVRPQNHFPRPMPWHALWDSARSLLNRSFAADFPGTLAFRRDIYLEMNGYDGDVMFENLELIRTLQAHGARERIALDLYVERLAPSTARFWSQRVRQAYDEFALPGRMASWLAVPLITWRFRRNPRILTLAAGGAAVLAERGRRRAGGARVFPWAASLLAPVWILERGICSWLAVAQWATGGVRYGDRRIKKAANPAHALRRLARRDPAR